MGRCGGSSVSECRMPRGATPRLLKARRWTRLSRAQPKRGFMVLANRRLRSAAILRPRAHEKGRRAMNNLDKVMLSAEKLQALVDRAKEAAVNVRDARDKARIAVEQFAEQAHKQAAAQAEKLQQEAASTDAHVSKSWHEVQKEWKAHLETTRQKIDDRKATLDAEDAEASAVEAEDDAFYALDYAYGTIADAESAALEAIA